jgi:hypothetical protein
VNSEVTFLQTTLDAVIDWSSSRENSRVTVHVSCKLVVVVLY